MAQRYLLAMRLRDWALGLAILTIAMVFMWVFMIRPHNFEWIDGGEAKGTVKTLMSNQTVIGSPSIKAIVNLQSGGQTIVNIPIKSDIRAGSTVTLSVRVDKNNDRRRRYRYKGVES